jgi:hypothetical protein
MPKKASEPMLKLPQKTLRTCILEWHDDLSLLQVASNISWNSKQQGQQATTTIMMRHSCFHAIGNTEQHNLMGRGDQPIAKCVG